MPRRQQKLIATGRRINKEPKTAEKHSLKRPENKGAFLVRQFGNPRSKLIDAHGKSTLLALSARDCGESVPKNAVAARKLAKKGEAILKKLNHETKKKTA